jgi:predicted MFS family arabinose efflux permease
MKIDLLERRMNVTHRVTGGSCPSRDRQHSLWPAFVLGLAVATGNGLARFAYALLVPAMREDLSWTYAQAGWLNTANSLGYVIGALLGYFLLSHKTPDRLFSYGLVLTIVSLSATGLGGTLAWLTMMRLSSGIGAALVFACGSALIAYRYRNSVAIQGTAAGLYFAGAGLGIVLSSVAIHPLLAWLGAGGWSLAWGVLGLMAFVLSVWPLRAVRAIRGTANAANREPLRLTGTWAPLLAYFVFAAGYIVYMTFILTWLRIQGWSWTAGMTVWLILGAGVCASPFLWRRALVHWNPTMTLAASCAVTFTGSVIPLVFANMAGLLLSAIIFGLGVFIAPSAVALLVRMRMQATLWAKGMTLFTVVFAVGQSVGPLAAGWIADAEGLDRSLAFGAALLLVSALLALSGAIGSSSE